MYIYVHFTLTNNWLVVSNSQLRRFIYIEHRLYLNYYLQISAYRHWIGARLL